MSLPDTSRRDFLKAIGSGAASISMVNLNSQAGKVSNETLSESFLIDRSELKLRFEHPTGARCLSFHNFKGSAEAWKEQCLKKLTELLNFSFPKPCNVRELRYIEHQGVIIRALVMEISDNLSITAYLLIPKAVRNKKNESVDQHLTNCAIFTKHLTLRIKSNS